MKSLRKTPPQCDARLARRAFRKVVASLVSAALFAALLFAVSVAVSQPAAGTVRGNWAAGFTLVPGGSRTVEVPLTSSNAAFGVAPGGWYIQCNVTVPSTSRFTVSINRCSVTVNAKATASDGCENLAVSGLETRPGYSGGGTKNFGTWRLCVRNSDITFNAPSPAPTIQAGGSLNLSMDTYASDSSPSTGGFTITCGTITEASALISLSDQQGCDVTVNAGSTTGTANISIPYTSSGGDTHTGTVTVRVITASNITFTAPSGLKVGTNRTQTINALDYATEANSDFTITCGDATNIDTTELQSVSRSGCVFTVTPKAVQGAASFTVPYTSSGGDTENGVINIEVGPESTVAYTAPGTLNLGRNLTLAIDALGYVTEDPAYTVTCGDATGVDGNKLAVTHTGSSCNFTIDPVDTLAPANQGDTTFTIPYTSDGGHSTTGMVTVNIGPDSNLSFTAPSTLTVGRNYTLVIDALDHVSENTGHTVTCADPTGVDATKMTVTRSTSGDGCSFTVDPVDTLTPANQGDTTFSVLFTTTGGTTTTGTFTINIGADSNIVLSDPGTLTVARNRTRTFVASSYATDGSFTFSCGDATGVDTTKMTVTHTGSSCSFTIDPVDTLTPADQGDTTFSVAFTSSGGATTTGTFTVNIGPDSTLAFTALPTLTVGRNYTLVIDALDQITETGVYTVTCADATGVDAVRMTVTRSVSGDGCSFTVDPENALAQAYQGDTTFTVEFTSTGSATVTGTFTINIGTDSIIAYTAPADLRIEAGSRTLEIDAGGFAADGSYALTCSDASALTSNLASVAHTGSSCTFTATTTSGTASGSASFTITYTSAGGDTRQAVVPVSVGPARNLVFTAPSALAIGAGGTLVFDVSSYATDGGFWGVTCGDSTANTARIASVARVGDTCEFRVTAGSSLGAASFTVPYTSETGAMVSGVVPVVVGAAANIVFSAPVAGFPSGLNVEATKSIVIDASAYASDGSYTISCGDAESVSSLWQSVVRDSGGNGCSFTATARAGAGGTAGFTVPYGSSRGGSADGVISVLIRPLSDIVFTAPPTTGAGSLSVLAGRVLVLDASSYAADGDYAISCGAIAESSALISLGTQSGCVVPITAVSGAGTAAISVPYTSSGGDTHTGMISLSVSRAVSGTAIPLLSNAGCTDGTFVNLTTNPRVTGANNDLAEDCMTLVAIQNHFAGFEANRDLAEFHAFREWGDASVEWGTGTASDRLVQNWIGITVTGGRVTDFVISATRSTVGGQFTIVSGTLPSEIQNLTALERLEADDHMLSGNIPSWLGSMSALNDVNLSGNNFSGPIPSELGNLSSLQFLNLADNELSGSIPSQLGSLSNLVRLYLDRNQLTGSIPSQLGSLSSTAFRQLNLSDNRLSGSIPSQLTSLTAMRNLLLSNNLLTGGIPSGIGSLTSLITLDLEGNRLSGSIPTGISSLSSLFRLVLSNNQFTGAIPAAVGNLVTLNPAGNRFTGVRQVYICGNYFTGALPTGLQQTASNQYVLWDYPIAEGFNPVACQDAMAVPASGDIVFAPPLVVPVQAGGESVYVNAASYFTSSDYAATCADATGPAIDDSKLTITRSGCSYNITAPAPSPISRAFENVTFNVPYTQVSAGATQVNGVVTVRILPASSIAFTTPSNLFVSASSTVVVDASGAATDGPYAISCGDATGVDSTKFSSVVRSTSGNGCMFTIASTASTGDGTFTVPFTSSGGATGTGTFTVNVNNIVYTAPTDLSVAAGRSIEITASSYVTDGANTFTCADATNIDSAKITSVVRNNCVFTVTTAAAAAGENVAITVPVTSSGGATRSIVIPIAATPVSDIVFTAPAAVKIGAGNTKTIDVGAYAADGSYTVSCGFQQSTRHARLTSVAVNGCSFTLAAGSAQGAATLVVDYTSTGGDTQSGTVNLSIGPPSSVSFTAPAVPAVGRNRTLVINALDYVRENTAYAVSCSDAFDISTLPNIGFGLIRYRMSVARSTSGDGCAFTVDPLNTLPSNRWGNAIFRVVFTSEGGSSTTGTFTVNIRGDVAILFTDPGALAVPRNRILRIDATDHVEDGANTITCADATGFDSDKMAVTRRGCVYTVNPVNSLADSLLGETTFSAMFTSSGGSSTTGTFTVDIGPDTNIRTTNIPGTLFFTNSVKVNLSRFATDGDYEIFCTSVSATAGTISNRAANSCVFDYSPSFLGRFNVSFRSAGGSTTTASINVAQSLGTYLRSFSFPAQSVAAGRTIEIEASRHISLSTANTYFCFEPTNVDGKISVVLRGCRYIITAGSRQGAASFNVNFSVTSGEVRSAAVAVNVGPASDITFNAPAGLQVGRNRTLAIDATDYATDSSYTITCGDATGVDSTKLTSVSRNGCVFTVDPINSLAAGSQGDTSFTVPFTSSGGDTATGAFTVNIGPDSTITYTAPGALEIGRNFTFEIDASDYVSEISGNGYTIACSDAAGVDANRMAVTRTANTCEYTVAPVGNSEANAADRLAPALQGDTTFAITFASTGGHTITRTLTINIGPDSVPMFTAPAANPAVGASLTRAVDVSSYATDGNYTISCGTITETDADITLGTQTGCSVLITSVATTPQTADITIPYTSSGGGSTTGTLTLDVGVASNIVFNAPTGLKVGINRTQTIDASDYAADGGNTISCGTATNIDTTRLASVVRDTSGNGCSYTITPISTLTQSQQGTANFTVPYTSSGGDTQNGVIPIEVGPASNIVYTSPGTLSVARNRTLEIDASGYAADNAAYTISCGDATGVASARLAVTHTGSSCDFTIDPVDALAPGDQGTTTFTIPFTSDGGATATGTVTVNIGPDSALTFTAPGTFTLGRNRTLVIDASAAISGENAAYTVSCADATGADATRMTVARSTSGDGCSFTVDPVDTLAVGSQGDTTFSVAFSSTGGATATGTFTINIGPDSTITANIPPATGAGRLQVARNLTLEIDASDYVAETSGSGYTISCSDARSIHSRLTSVARTANTCTYTIDPVNSATSGTATFVVTFTSTGGHSIDRTITVNVGPNSAITYAAPPTTGANRLLVGRNRTLAVDAGSYASETSGSGYTISCGDAVSIDTARLASVTHTGSSCSFTVTPVSSLSSTLQATNATFTVPYASSGGATADGIISVKVGPDSTITFNAPTLARGSNLRTFTIDASDYVAETAGSGYTISCGTATSVDTTEITSVTRLSNSCRYRIVLNGTQGSTGFTVPYTSTGGHAISRAIQITVGAASAIVFSAPASNPAVAASRTLTLDVGSYAADGSYTISCGTITESSALISLGNQTQGSCSIPIIAGTSTGTAAISVPYISSGGATLTRSITIDVGGASNISFTAPSDLKVGINRTQTINALDYASDSGYTITCGTATSVDTTRLTSVVRDASGNGCGYTITPISTLTQSQQGAASFTVPLTSDGGDTENAVFSIAVGPASTITFTPPSALLVPKNRTLVVDAAPYAVEANPTNYAISCGDATSIDTVELQSVTRTANTCTFTITPKNVAGSASFTVPYTSEGGHSVDGAVPVTVGTDSTITFTSPGTLTVGRNRTLTIDASGYVEEIASSGHTITCSDASGVDSTKLTSVTRTANTCSFTITPVSSLSQALQGDTTFSITFTSSGGHSITRTITVNVGPDSALTFTAPSTFTLGRNRTLVIDALDAISGENADYTVNCADATGVDATKMTVTRSSSGDGCSFTVDPVDTLAVGSQGDTTFSVAFTSTGGATASGTFTVNIGPDSTITTNIPPATGANRLLIGRNLTLTIDASDYVAEETGSGYTISCSDARNLTGGRLTSVTRTANTCSYTIDPNNSASSGAATFTVTFTSTGGHSVVRVITVNVGPNSAITFNAPPTSGANRLTTGRNRALVVNAASYARETSGSGYTITCGDATGIDTARLASVTHTGSSCSFTVTPVSTLSSTLQATNAAFTVPYSSTGGAAATGTISVKVGPDSTITYNAPTLERGNNLRTFTIDASDYVSETSGSGYTISCGTATSVDTTEITSVTRLSNSCRYRIVLNGTQGTTGFTVPYTSTGGHAISRAVQITVGAASSIVFSAPSSNPAVAASRTLTLDVSSYATDGSYTISCGTITEFSALISLGSQTGCSIPITAATSTGTAFISVPYISSGGATTTRSISIDVGVASDIQFTAPSNLKVGINRTQTINALDYATDSGYTITCGTATSIDTTKLTSVARDSSGNGCGYTITPISTLTQSQQGSANFTVPLTSDGGDTENAVFSIAVGPASTITFTAPSALLVPKNRTLVVDAASYAVEANPSNYAISCGDATGIDTVELQSVTRAGNTCTFTITPKNVTGSASFTVPYTSEGGHSVAGVIPVTVGTDSTITFTSPGTLTVGRNRTLTIDASGYVEEIASSGHTITCSDASGVDSTKLTSVTRTANTCSFTITPITTLTPAQQGNATFRITFTSSGGHSITRTITVRVGPDSTIVFAAPASNPAIAASRTRTLDVSSYASDGSYTISCGAITESDPDITLGTQDGCSIPITAGSTPNQTADITIPYRSTGGHSITSTLTLDVGAASSIVFTAPTGLAVGINRTQRIDALDYASDGGYTITCGTAANTGANVPTSGTVALASVVRDASGNGCGYTIRPTSAQGTATFTIPYTSAGGDTANGNISITVGAASNIRYSSPGTLRVGRNQTLEIDASGYASDSSYAITCADATGVDNTKLTSVSRTANSCDFTIDPVDALAPANQGTTTFSIAFTSAGGHSITRSIAVNIGPDSNLTFTAPGTFTLGRNRTLAINALAAISGENAAYTVSCADATGVDANKMTVTRSSSGNRCSFTVDPVDTLVVGSQGDATFAVAFSSTGGATASGTFTVNIGPDSTITANIPPATGANRLQVARNLTLEIDASGYVSEASPTNYTISCSDARSIHSRLTSVARTANTCRYTIDPNNFAFPGAATFVVTFTSTGGHSIDRTITVNVGANSQITFTAPPTTGANRLLVGRNRALVVDAGSYARETFGSGYTISCGDATSIDSTRLASVTHSGSSCSFTVTPVSSLSSSLQATNATFTVPYSSTGGATATGTISVKVGPDSTITYNAPTLERGSNLRTFTIDASDYVSETSGSGYTISCGTATSVDTTEITSVTRLSNSCRYRIVLNGTQGTTSFTVPYTSTGGHAISRAVQITVGPASSIVFSAPSSNPAVAASRTLTLDVSSYATDGSYTISCGTISEFSALISLGAQTGCSIPITAATSTGTAFISVPYISSGGATTTRSISIDVGVASDIQFTAPSDLKVGINRTQTINALDYATDSGYTITCGTATSVDSTKLTSVVRDSSGNGCGYTITPISTLTPQQQGSASFTVPLTSDGGDTENAVFSIAVGPASTITFTAPVGANALSVAKNRTLVVDVSGYAVEANPTNYAISCGDATSIDTVELQSVTHTGSSCTFTINPKNVAGSASFTVPYTSEGGHSVNGAISVTVGPDSNIVYTPPTGLRLGRNRTLVIDATNHFTEDSTYTVTCGDATGIDNTRLTSVARTANTCTFTVDPVDTLAVGLQGNTSFTVPLSSTGGHTRSALFTVNVGPDSNIVFAAPTGLKVGRNRTLAINALAAVTENPAYTVTCADATGVSANRMTVTRSSTGSRCVFTVDPVDTLATGLQGDTTFAVAFTSTGGATASGTFTVNIGPDSTITYNAPTGLLVGRNRTLTIDASGYVSESDSNNTITCGDATAIHSRLTSVARTANSCSYTIDPNNFATPGTATFSIAFTSDGGHTRTETISVEIGPNSTIRFTAPPTFGPNRLRIGRNLTLAIDALDYVAENMAYTVTCGDATGVDAARLTVTHTGSSCDFTIDPVDTLAQSLQGNTSFTIPYTSNGGATATGRITVNIGPDSAITFTPPTGLKIGRNRTLVIDALAAISGENAAYTVSCADATGVDANRMTVTRSSSGNRCSFTVDPVDTLAVGSQGDTTFVVAFASTGGATASGTFTVNIGPDSTIVYTAPTGLLVGRNRTLSVDVSSAATDGSYTVTCGDAANVHPRFSSVTRPDAQASPCVFAAAPRTTASLGTASFVVPFVSDGGATSTGTVSIAISQPSAIVFTAPDPALQVGINRTRVIDALDYARDGNYTITCLDATGVDSTKLTTVTRSSAGNGCGYTINPISSLTQSQQGDATFTVPYRSAGGHVLNQEFTIGVGPASTIVYTAPVGANALTVGHNRTLTIDASSYATDGSYTISCGDARSIHARIDHITRNGCSFTITPVSGMTGAATFTIPYSSDGGHTRDGQVSVAIGAASNIVYSAPSGIVIPASTARTIDASSYATDGSYAISCGDATGVNASRLASVTHTGTSCSFEITAAANQGSTSFVVPYRSAGGATLSGTISLSVGPASSIVFTAPSGLDVHVGETLLVHANDYASDGPYSLQCADATNRSASLTSVIRTADTCDYTITPGSSTGTGTFNVAYTSSGGATATGTISVNISPQSTIAFTAPTGLSVAAGRSVTVDASTAADTGYTVSCGEATAVNPRIASVSRTGCSYVVRAGSIAGSASFTIPFTSTGGATLNVQIAIAIGPRSSIAFTAPAGLSVQIGSTLTIDASDYASDSAYTITCGDATGISTALASVARTASTCSFVITPGASTGTGSFTVPYTSSGGATRNGSITVAVTPTSSIVFAPPPTSGPDRLRIGAGNTRTINLASYATDGPYSITCGNATASEPAKLTDIHRNACRYTITAAAAAAQGDTTFSLTYTSSGGNTSNASFTINIGPASDIVYAAPADITLQANSARGIDLSSYATDGTGNDAYTIGCLDATDIDPEISSVARNGCVYTIRAGSTPGEADFHITYTSTGGDTHLATVHITITPAPAEPEERPAGPIQPIDPPARRPTPPPPTTTTTTTIPDPSRPTTTLEPDQPGPRWNTLTAQQGGTTPGQIRQAFNLGSTQTIYTWNTATQTWTRATRGAQSIPAGTRVSFRTEEAVSNREMRTSNLGGDTTRMRLTSGWATLSIPQGITRTDDTDFLLDPTLTDCRNQQGIIAIASYSTRSRRWSISLPCHPTAQRRLTTGENAPYRPLMSIAPADTIYIFTRTRQPLNIRWDDDTQTYQAFQSIFG